MSFNSASFIINNIKLPLNASIQEAFSVASKRISRIGIAPENIEFKIFKRSIDARKKYDICFVYSVIATGKFSPRDSKKMTEAGFSAYEVSFPEISFGNESLSAPPVIVGAGPAGMFAALLLAENGYNPVLIERGGDVEERKRATERFNTLKILDPSTNIQFGAGGAGTFSDGKLVTRINDPLSGYVMDKLVEFGAPKEILYLAKPHVGTDILSDVVERILNRITELGGVVHYHTTLLDLPESSGRINNIITSNGNMPCGALVLAVGHSARDTYSMLLSKCLCIEAKSFSVGMRIEHLAENIDKAMFGDFAGHPALGHGEYNLSYNTQERGVYTFCMCPGGEVVAAASEEHGVVSNGMSKHSRQGINSNSAVCCTIFKEDYGSSPAQAIEFQRKIERSAFIAGGSDYSAPIITVGDFLSDRLENEPSVVMPTYMGGEGVRLADPKTYLPDIAVKSIKNALYNFNNKIKGFADKNAVLTGAETRTSAPVRILRDNETRLALGFDNLYPAGEGAGYAGGITSAAIDGIKTAIAIMAKFRSMRG